MGFVILAAVFAFGMGLSIHRFESAADEQIAHLRSEEREISLVERLRWSSELIVADGRGYLLARDPTLLERLHDSKVDIDGVLSALQSQSLSPESRELTNQAERAVRRFVAIQEALVEARQESADTRTVTRRFEVELLPARRELEDALQHLAAHKRDSIRRTYEAAERERASLSTRLYGFLVVLLLVSTAIASYFAKLLGHSLQGEQQALAAARSAVAVRDDLMSIVAHDLRNPLNAVTVQASLMRDAAESAELRDQAESIIRIGKRMDNLIRTTLDAATIEAGRFTIQPARCKVDDLLRESLETFTPLAAARGIHLECHVAGGEVAVTADRDRILQVLSNLLGNALKFTSEGGTITLTREPANGTVRFAVGDTGPGIASENLARVFDRFWKDESRGRRGTGLGLFIAKGIVDAHDGTIWVESDLGRGSSFFFTLPEATPRLDPPW